MAHRLAKKPCLHAKIEGKVGYVLKAFALYESVELLSDVIVPIVFDGANQPIEGEMGFGLEEALRSAFKADSSLTTAKGSLISSSVHGCR